MLWLGHKQGMGLEELMNEM